MLIKQCFIFRKAVMSKRRSPWLCPAPSGGAGLFLFCETTHTRSVVMSELTERGDCSEVIFSFRKRNARPTV